jgi:glycosyltransferase involved in cell wall biosynthesis
MMTRAGHTVHHYGIEDSDPECASHTDIMSKSEYKEFFPTVDYTKDYYPVQFNDKAPYFDLTNKRANEAIKAKANPREFVCILGGWSQRHIMTGLNLPCVEYGIGYYGVIPSAYWVFESYAHMHVVYGQKSKSPDGRFCDAVIPNYFDLNDFTPNYEPGQYFLYMGRLIYRKGVEIAVEATRRAGVKLLVCGQGEPPKAPHVEYVGYADVKRRDELMRNAKALLCPTLYVEPFGGVNVEAQICGTPVICTDWGAFTETVEQGKTGYRCRLMKEFVNAIRSIEHLDRQYISDRAIIKYTLPTIAKMYENYFDRLYIMLYDGGWNG